MKKKILLVEDEAILALTTSMMLEEHHFEVITVHDGEKAINTVDEDLGISLILMDIDLGKGIDGTEAAKEILKNHDIPIIFHTSHSEKEYVDKVKKITGYGYVLKNSGEFVLIESINMAFKLFEAVQHRKQHEQALENTVAELKNTNRALRTLSECNQVLVRNATENTLLQEICDVIVNTAGYKLCWFGYVEGSKKDRIIAPAAYAGIGKEYIEKLQIRIDEGSTSKGPTAKAIRTKEASAVNRIFDNPDYAPWRDAAIQHGYQSSIALPLMEGDTVFAVLNIYAAEPEVFQEEENILLMELAEDLSYGIRNIRSHQLMDRNEKLLDNIIENLPLGLQIFDEQGFSLRINKKQKELLGVPSEKEGIGEFNVLTDPYSIAHGADRLYREVYKGNSFIDMENEYNFDIPVNTWETRKEKRYFNESIFPIFTREDHVGYVVSLLADVTEKYDKERQITANERKYRGLFNSIRDAILVADTERNIIDCNPAFTDLFGYTLDDLKSKKTITVYQSEDEYTHMGKALKEHKGSLSDFLFTVNYKKSNGTTFPGETNVFYLRNDFDQVTGFIGLIRDISSRKKAEKELRDSRNKYKRLVNNSPNMIMETDVDTHEIISCNPAMARNLGFPITSIVGKKIEEFIPPGILQKRIEISEKVVETGEAQILEDEREGKCFYTTYIPIVSDERRSVQTVTIDVTEQKKSENLLKEYANRLELIMEAANMAWWEMDINSGHVRFNKKKAEMLGYSPDLFHHYEDFTKLLHFDDHEPAMAAMRALLQGSRDAYDIEYRIKASSGDYRWFHDIGTITHRNNAGEPVKVSGIVLDITERKLTEAELRRKAKDLRESQRIAHIGSWRLDVTSNQVTWTEELYNMYGFDPLVPPPPYTEHMKLFTPESWERLSAALEHTRQTGIPYMLELETVRKDGSNGWMWVQGEADVDSAGNTIEIWGAAQDITERKRAEMKLAESEALLDATSFLTHVGGWQLDVKTKAITWTKETYRIHEVPLDYMPSLETAIQFFHPDDRDVLSKAIQRALDRGEPYDMELRFITAKGNSRWTRAICKPEVVNGKTVRLSGTFQDITERKRLEIELKTKTEFLENVTENMFDMVSLTDLEGKFIFVGKSHKILGYNPDALTGKKVFDLVHPEDLSYIINEFSEFLKDKMPRKVEYRCICADGTYLWVETLGRILRDENGNPEQIIFSTRDITERRQKETVLHKALKEKEFLMKELSHRVKNNLAMVSSLIYLKDLEITEDLSDLKNRVDVINLVHEKLHQQNDAELIEVREYFQELLAAVFSSASNVDVEVINTIKKLSIPTKIAMPLGLIINEIATNAIKYGFTPGKEARFTIDMKWLSAERQYVLTLSNTGNPFPEDVDLNNTDTMGLQLISTLVSHLDGSLELQKKPSTLFRIKFLKGDE